MSVRDNAIEALVAIAREAKQANDVISLNRDGQGQGRVRVATAMHRIEAMASTVLAAEQARNAAPDMLSALKTLVDFVSSELEGDAGTPFHLALGDAQKAIAKAEAAS